MRDLLLRILIIIPWLLLIWFISQGFNGQIDGLLVFVLTILLIPLIIAINIISIVTIKGRRLLKKAREASQKQAPLKTKNYAELPWWDPKRWQ